MPYTGPSPVTPPSRLSPVDPDPVSVMAAREAAARAAQVRIEKAKVRKKEERRDRGDKGAGGGMPRERRRVPPRGGRLERGRAVRRWARARRGRTGRGAPHPCASLARHRGGGGAREEREGVCVRARLAETKKSGVNPLTVRIIC